MEQIGALLIFRTGVPPPPSPQHSMSKASRNGPQRLTDSLKQVRPFAPKSEPGIIRIGKRLWRLGWLFQRVLHAPCNGSMYTRYHPKASGDHPQAFGNTRQSGSRRASSPGNISRNVRKVPHRARTVRQHPLKSAICRPVDRTNNSGDRGWGGGCCAPNVGWIESRRPLLFGTGVQDRLRRGQSDCGRVPVRLLPPSGVEVLRGAGWQSLGFVRQDADTAMPSSAPAAETAQVRACVLLRNFPQFPAISRTFCAKYHRWIGRSVTAMPRAPIRHAPLLTERRPGTHRSVVCEAAPLR